MRKRFQVNREVMSTTEKKQDKGALILSSGDTSLGIVRSLGRHDIRLYLVDDKRSPAYASRYVKHRFRLGGETEAERVGYLIDLAEKNNLKEWAIFPDGDRWAAFLARNKQTLDMYFKMTTPSWDILKWSIDKRLTYQLAAEAGVHYPLTYYPEDRVDVEKINGSFPMILKPAHHERQDPFSGVRAWQVNSKAELLSFYDRATALTDTSNILIQEMIPGGVNSQFSYAALCKDGKVLADAFVERKRLRPPDFGAGVYVETIIKPEIEMPAKQWLAKNSYTGLVEIDFKYDSRDGRYKLLDVNARPWAWIALCASAGVDFPFLMWKMLQGEEIKFARARPHIRWVRTIYDLSSSVYSIRKGELSIKKYFASLKGVKHETFALDDPWPALAELFLLLNRGLRKIFI